MVGGFPVHDIRVIVHDGKSHPVDSKDIAFFTAGRKATIQAIQAASPIMHNDPDVVYGRMWTMPLLSVAGCAKN